MFKLHALKKTFILQQDKTDCGVACLLSIIRYYKGGCSLERLRELSGTTTTGTTLLGLYECANQLGLTAKAFQAELADLKTVSTPCILHVVVDGILQHYVVCYGYSSKGFIIGDPATGVALMSESQLEKIWQSKTLLHLVRNITFQTDQVQRKAKWSWFKQIVKDDLNILLTTMVLGVLMTLITLATAVFYQKLVDEILPQGNERKLIIGIGFLLLVLLIKSGLNFIKQHLSLLQEKNFNNRIISTFFELLVHLPKTFFDTRKTGDMISRMNDTSRIQKNIAYVSGSVFIDLIVLISTSFFLMSYSKAIALVTFTFIPMVCLITFSYSKKIKYHQIRLMSSSSNTESSYIDVINGIMTIKSNKKEAVFTNKISSIYNLSQEDNLALGKVGNRFVVTTEIISTVVNILLVTIASFMVMRKQLLLGEMMAVISLASALIPAVCRLSQINIHFQEAIVAFNRMYDFTSIKPEYKPTLSSEVLFHSLKVSNVSFRFPGRKTILHGINFDVKKGEVIAIMGESGAGKSTIIAILEKYYPNEEGDILVNNMPLSYIDTSDWRNVIATVPQEIKIFNGTVLDNIALGHTEQEISTIIDFCRIYKFSLYFESLPQSYFTLIGEEGINLSGGQKQILAFARALYRKPQLLILDEATSALDKYTEQFILSLIVELRDEMATILVTHKIETATIANRIYLIECGEIHLHVTPDIPHKPDILVSHTET